MVRPRAEGIELGQTSNGGVASAAGRPTRTGHHASDDEDDFTALNLHPSSTELDGPAIPTAPDGEIAEHRALTDHKGTRYVSLDPARRLSIWLGKGKWPAIAAVSTLVIFLLASAIIALWESAPVSRILADNGGCPYLDYVAPLGIIKPSVYNISLGFTEANFDINDTTASSNFSGRTVITFSALKETSEILLHSVDLRYSAASLSVDGVASCICGSGCHIPKCDDVIKPLKTEDCSDLEAVSIELVDRSLGPGTAEVTLTYTGKFNPNRGIYRSEKRTDNQGSTKLMLASQFETRGARHAFPCIDEPAQKARFNIDITTPKSIEDAYTNSAIHLLEKRGDQTRRVYQTSPVMSTYLVAFCLGNLEPYTGTLRDPAVTILNLPSARSPRSFKHAYEEATRALNFYIGWTGVTQPFETFAMVAVPGKLGAMENWALLQFDPERFSVDWDQTKFYGAWRMANVICHEVAHQWFGNTITTADWRQLTVNEGTASFMEYLCFQGSSNGTQLSDVGHVLSQRTITPLGQPIGSHEGPRAIALAVDTHPYTSSLVPGPMDAPPVDGITYSKGASILQMLYATMEEAKPGSFQAGLRKLLKHHMSSTATVEDILAALDREFPTNSAASPRNLTAFYHQAGYPLLTVSTAANNSEIVVTQSRYLDWSDDASTPRSSPWTLPISVGFLQDSSPSNRARNTFWLSETETRMTVQPTGNSSAVEGGAGSLILNANGKGLYRVKYPDAYLQRLITDLSRLNGTGETENLLAAEALVNDVFALFFQGSLSAQLAVQTAQAAVQSPAMSTARGQYLLGSAILEWLEKLKHLLNPDDACSQDLKAFTVQLLRPVARHVWIRLNDSTSSTEMLGDTATLYSLVQDSILGEVALAGDAPLAQQICARKIPAAVWAYVKVGVAYPTGCSVPLPSDASRTVGAAEMWMEAANAWSDGDVGDLLLRAALFSAAHTEQASLIQIMVNAIVEQDVRTLLLATNNTHSTAARQIASRDEAPLLEVLSRSKFGATAVWQALYQSLKTAPKSDRIWTLLNGISIYPTQDTLTALEGIVGTDPRDWTSTQKQVIGKLRHLVKWRAENSSNVCRVLKSASIASGG